MSKKYIPFILTIVAVVIATFLWEKIVLTYDIQNQIYGEYSINQYNANNDLLRSLFFILFPLIFFFFSYLILNNEITLSIKELIFDNEKKAFKEKFNLNYYFVFTLFIFFLLAEFLSIDFNRFAAKLDFFHEGVVLVPSSNFYLTKGFWSSSFIEYGFLGNFGTAFLWKIFGIKTIGLARFPELLFLLLNKILLVYLAMRIAKNLLFSERVKLVYFIILSILLISLISYKDNIAATEFSSRSFLFLLFFSVFFSSLYRSNRFGFTFFILGTFSIISMLWFIDVGAYINAMLLLILVYFFIRTEYKKFLSILVGVIFGWFIFFFIIPSNEFKTFLNNTLLIYSTYDYIWGLIYPTPFLSGDARSTRALLFIILAGVLVIISSFNKKIKLTYYNKIFFIFIFIAALISFKTGMTRSDTPHIKSSSGFTLFLIYSLGLFFLFSLVLNQNKLFLSGLGYFVKKNYTKFLLILLAIYFVTFKASTINFNNISSAPSQIIKLINYEDEKYLSSDYSELIKYYKNLSLQDQCIQIITNESALPYFINKPTCTKFYLIWSSEINQKKLINQLKKSRPEIILFNSEIDPWNGDFLQRVPMLVNYINKNYSFYSKFKFWTFVKMNQ